MVTMDAVLASFKVQLRYFHENTEKKRKPGEENRKSEADFTWTHLRHKSKKKEHHYYKLLGVKRFLRFSQVRF
jgi:hypothetical protein